jgi:hypothetical protein
VWGVPTGFIYNTACSLKCSFTLDEAWLQRKHRAAACIKICDQPPCRETLAAQVGSPSPDGGTLTAPDGDARRERDSGATSGCVGG